MKRWAPKSEVELARPVVEWLEHQDWEVYQEVSFDGDRADIVAVSSKEEAWIIECKRSLTLELIAQAWRWRSYARWSSVVVPDGPQYWNDARKLGQEILVLKGIGYIPVGECGVVEEHVKPAKDNLSADSFDLLKMCTSEHKTVCPAGSKGGGYVTPFKQTLKRLEAFVVEHPGVELKMAAKLVEHHYGGRDPAFTFRVNIEKLIKKGVIKTLRAEEKAGLLCLFPIHPESKVIASVEPGGAAGIEGSNDASSAADSLRD